MGERKPFSPVKLIMGVLSTHPEFHKELYALLEKQFGPIEELTHPIPFTFTDYYDEEMGASPQRFFIIFKNLINPEELVTSKLKTNRLEKQFAVAGNRTINLDPGILSAENLILATTKNRGHRLPLSQGIYGEVTLMYSKKTFQSFSWTYADYGSDAFKQLFLRIRQAYLLQLKNEVTP